MSQYSYRECGFNGKILIYTSISFVVLIGIVLVLWEVNSGLQRTFSSVIESLGSAQVEAAAFSLLLEPSSAPRISASIIADIQKYGPVENASSAISGFYRVYVKQLVYTLCLVIPVAFLLPLLVYMLASVISEAENQLKTWRCIPRFLVELFDQLPYILWALPAISLATWFLRERPGNFLDIVYFNGYILIGFVGFGLFLVIFFYHQQAESLKVLRRTGVIYGEQLLGFWTLLLYCRLLWFHLRGTVIRQMLYAALFILLFEFSFNNIHAIHQPGLPDTVFSQGNSFFQLAKKHDVAARLALGQQMDLPKSLHKLLMLSKNNGDWRAWAEGIIQHPELALNAVRLAALRQWVQQDTYEVNTKHSFIEIAKHIKLSSTAQNAVYFKILGNSYIFLNGCFLFLLFFIIFLFFDLPALINERED